MKKVFLGVVLLFCIVGAVLYFIYNDDPGNHYSDPMVAIVPCETDIASTDQAEDVTGEQQEKANEEWAIIREKLAEVPCDKPDISMSDLEDDIFKATNVARRANGGFSFVRDPSLDKAAAFQAYHLAERPWCWEVDHRSHYCDQEDAHQMRIFKAGFLGFCNADGRRVWNVTENTALRSPNIATGQQFVDAWLASPGHRAAILNKTIMASGPAIYSNIGVGCAFDIDNNVVCVQDFGAADHPENNGKEPMVYGVE